MKTAKAAVHKHESNMHPGKPKTSFNSGGAVSKVVAKQGAAAPAPAPRPVNAIPKPTVTAARPVNAIPKPTVTAARPPGVAKPTVTAAKPAPKPAPKPKAKPDMKGAMQRGVAAVAGPQPRVAPPNNRVAAPAASPNRLSDLARRANGTRR